MNLFNFRYYQHCNCGQGNITDSFDYDDNKWCCNSVNEDCILTSFGVNCTGKTLSLQEQCPNQGGSNVCNHYPNDPDRNNDRVERSYLNICDDNR